MVAEKAIRRRFRLIEPHLDERLRRLVAAAEAAGAGAGGVSAVARATGVSRRAIRAGAQELKARGAAALAPGRIRRPGGGRKRTIDQDPTLVRDLEQLIEPTTRGDPESPLRWTCKSVRRLATELTHQGHRTSHRMVAVLLRQQGYSLQANRKTIEGTGHPDRNAQFEHIAGRVGAALRHGQPAISVDTKKKELVGNFKNAGREWRAGGQPTPVGATAPACGCGKSNCRNWRTACTCPSRCVISRPARASGTRSNTACSPSSARTGEASPCSATRSLSI